MTPKSLGLILALAGSIHAADRGWIPITGVVLDPENQSLRPIQGLPGASLLGPAVNLPVAVKAAAIFRERRRRHRSGCHRCRASSWLDPVQRSAQRQRTARRHRGSGPHRDKRIGIRRRVGRKASSQLRFVSVQEQPRQSISLMSVLGSVGAIAVSSDGTWALIGAADSGTGGIYRIGPATGNQAQFIYRSSRSRPSSSRTDALFASCGY